jgi:hypothetical protein
MCTQIYIGYFKSIYFFMISVEIVYNMTKKIFKVITTLFRCISNQCCSCYILKIKLYIIHVFKRSELTQFWKIFDNRHKTCTLTPKSSNQNCVCIGYDILIGGFLSMSTNLVLKSFITIRPDQVFY